MGGRGGGGGGRGSSRSSTGGSSRSFSKNSTLAKFTGGGGVMSSVSDSTLSDAIYDVKTKLFRIPSAGRSRTSAGRRLTEELKLLESELALRGK